MNTASLELCKELYELSRWGDTCGEHSPKGHWWPRGEFLEFHTCSSELPTPAYDLGYLLRKLHSNDIHIQAHAGTEWMGMVNPDFYTYAATPEDAAAKLAIELFKQGVLK